MQGIFVKRTKVCDKSKIFAPATKNVRLWLLSASAKVKRNRIKQALNPVVVTL
jgi:hypothetical protein